MSNETVVYSGEAKWERPAYLKLVGTKVIFDCSDEEYGPIEFDIAELAKSLEAHVALQNQAKDQSK